VEKLHGLAGYEVVRVIIPEQELKEGAELTLQILDARLDLVNVKGNEFFSSEQIARELHVLEPGALLNTRDMDRNLRLMNDNPARTVRVSMEPSDKPGLVDANVDVDDSEPVSAFLTLDNTGTNATGDFRLGAVLQHNNLFERGHSASFQMVTSPGRWSEVKVYGLTYQVPFYEYDTLVEYSINDSTVNAGSLALGGSSLTINGAGTSQALKFAHLFDRAGGYDRRLTLSFEHKKFVSRVQFDGTGPSLVPNTASNPVGLTFTAELEEPEVQRAFSVGYFRNYFLGGENTTSQYQQENAAAQAGFDMIKFSASTTGLLTPTWRYTAKLDGQYSDFTLISGERFGAGGV
ncbi:MAG: ShlB/FhaC/HecB family hemolysin secretion/activation protein, partial [Limnobacter sp.]|nr:ShlB/FhaC/HecB family hemolysin secretion/activation protein [Limnobacter sp.]